MSEPVARQRPIINLDDFERRLRQPKAAPQQDHDDPLSELARLVGNEQDPYLEVFQDQADYQAAPPGFQNVRPDARQRAAQVRPPQPATPLPPTTPRRTAVPPPPPVDQSLRAERPGPALRVPTPNANRQERPAARPPQAAPPNPPRGQRAAPAGKNFGGDFAAIEAGLRGSIQPDYRTARADYGRDYRQSYQPSGFDEDDEEHWIDKAQAPVVAPRQAVRQPQHRQRQQPAPAPAVLEPTHSRRLLYVTAAIVLVGIGGIGVVFASKHTTVTPRQIAMIKAATSPAKIQAPVPAASDAAATAMQDDSVFDKTPSPPPAGVVNRAEQPVDLPQTAAAPAGQDAAPTPTPATEAPPWAVQPAPSPAAQAAPEESPKTNAQVADAAPSQAFALGGVQARKVHTIAVRPDGSVASDANVRADSPPAMEMPALAQGVAAPAAQGSDPGDAAAGPSPKATARIVTAAHSDTPYEGAANQNASSAADAAAEANEAPPLTANRPKPATHAKPVRTAALESSPLAETETAHASGGDFAVQLAAPASEAEAHHTIARLTQQYSDELAGHQLRLHHAKVGDKTVFRVRVSGLSKPAALKLCQALQAKGGSCFIAKD